tara:strand:+ start:261 stop:428 length:168 start_codon:yes stop_codon:yes gene_type:complete
LNEVEIVIQILTDDYSYETSWGVSNQGIREYINKRPRDWPKSNWKNNERKINKSP